MKNVAKRIASMVLCAAMLIGCANFSWSASSDIPSVSSVGETTDKKTDGQLIAENYSFFNAKERAIISCSALIGDEYEINQPSDDDGLLTIDAANKIVTAQDYKDGGLVWKPVSGKVIYKNDDGTEGEPIDFSLVNGKGSFETSSDRYSIEVAYRLDTDIEESLQKTLINAPADLVQGVINLNKLNNIRSALLVVQNNINSLYALTTGEMVYKVGTTTLTIKLPEDSEDSKAIIALYNEVKENGSFKLYTLLNNYNSASNKVKYLLDHGEEIKAENEKICAYFTAISREKSEVRKLISDSKTFESFLDKEIKSRLDFAEQGIDYMAEAAEVMADVMSDEWRALDHQIVKADATSAEMDALNTAVNAGITSKIIPAVSYYEAPEIKNPLTVANASVSKGVDQYKVVLTVSAQVVDKTSVDTNDTIALPEKKTQTFVLAKGATKEKILSEMEKSGVVSSALALWDPYYEIGDENYDTVISALPESLDADTVCTVVYTPKEYKITYNYEEVTAQTVKYGYNLLLPKHADSAKSYDYTVNGSLKREDTVQRITGDTVISRKEGKATDKYRVPVTIANSFLPGSDLSAEEKALLSSLALKEDNLWYRMPSQSSELVEVELGSSTGEYVVTASDYSSGLLSGNPWKAVKGYAYDKDDNVICEMDIKDGKCTFNSSTAVMSLKVAYEVEVTDIDADEVNAWLALPEILVNDAAEHRAEMAKLTAGNVYNNLAAVYGSRLGLIEAASKDFTPESKAAIKTLLDEAIDYSVANEPLYLYEYVTEYASNGLAYLYEDRVAENINRQVGLLLSNLEIVCADPAFEKLASNPDVSGYVERLYQMRSGLESVKEITVNERIDGTSDYLGSLAAAIDAAEGHTSAHTAENVVLRTNISATAPGLTNVIINVKVVNGKGEDVGVVATANRSYEVNTAYTAENIAELTDLLASLEDTLSYPVGKKYYVRSAEKALPEVGDAIVGKSVQYDFVWAPKQYSVVIDGTSEKFSFYADAALAVMLPACEQTGYAYRYRIGDTVREVSAAPVRHTFESLDAVEALAKDDIITIEREIVNVRRENTLGLIADLNNALYKNGLVYTMGGKKCLVAAFIPLEDPTTGDITIVLRVSPQNAGVNYQSVLTDVAAVLANTSFKYIGINGNTFWNSKVYLQSLINMMLASDLGFDYICDLIDAKGNIREITDEIPALSSLETIGASGADLYDHIADPTLLGGKLISAEMQFGSSASDAMNIPFYVTIEDFDLSASRLTKLKSLINKVKSYVNIKCADGALAVDVNMPGSLYPYYVAAMTIPGKADVKDLSEMELGDQMAYALDIVRDLIADGNLTTGTIERTIAKLKKNVDLGEYSSLFNNARKAADYLLKNAEVNGKSNGANYSGDISLPIGSALKNGLGIDDTLLSFIAEADEDSGLKADFSFTLKNMEKDYSALVIDYKASGLKKLSLTNDLTSVLANANKNTVVVLLSDTALTGDVTIKNRVIIDLNGYDLKGNIGSALSGGKDSVFIVDTRIGTYNCGTVNGTLMGEFTITGGRFTSDISAMLKDGYVQRDGYVVNSFFTSKEEGDDITIEVSLDFLTTHEIPDIKALAIDIALDTAVNMYAGAAMSVEGNGVYSINIENVFDLLSMSRSELLNMGLDWFDCDGITAIANKVIADLTDFTALSEAVRNNGVLASYTENLSKWDLKLSTEGDKTNNYIKPSIVSSSEAEPSRRINIKLSSDTSVSVRKKIADLLEHFGDIVEIKELSVDINDVSYDGSFTFDGGAVADVVLDLSKDKDYAAVIAVALANVTGGAYKAELVSAIKEYIGTASTAALKSAVEKATTAQFISAVKALRSKSFASMLSGIGVESMSITALEAVYGDVLKLGSAVLSKLNVKGGSRPLSTLSHEYGIYSVSRKNFHKCDIAFAVKLFTEDKAVAIRNSTGKIVYTTDSLDDAIANAGTGDTIYIISAVSLENDVTLDKCMSIVGAENIVDNGKKIILVRSSIDSEIILTADSDIEGMLVAQLKGYSVIKTEDNGIFTYTVNMPDLLVEKADGTTAEYAKDDFTDVIENANAGDRINVNVNVELVRDVTLSNDVDLKVIKGAKISSVDGSEITLANSVTLTSDINIKDILNEASGEYELVETQDGDKYVYTMKLTEILVYDGDTVVGRYTKDELSAAFNGAADGCVIKITADGASLKEDVALSDKSITIINAKNITVNAKRIRLAHQNAVLTADAALDEIVVSGLDRCDLTKTVNEDGMTVYSLSMSDIKVVHIDGTSHNYTGEELAKALAEVKANDVVYINKSVQLAESVAVKNNFEIVGASDIASVNDAKILLDAPGMQLISDSDIKTLVGVSDAFAKLYEVKDEESDGKYRYSLSEKEITDIIVTHLDGSYEKYAASELTTILRNAKTGDIIKINVSATLDEDIELKAAIAVLGMENVLLAGHKFILASLDAVLATDKPINGFVITSANEHVLEISENGSMTVYSAAVADILLYDKDGAYIAKYGKYDFAKAVSAASEGDKLVLNTGVAMSSDVDVTKSIRIEGAGELTCGSYKFKLAKDASVTSDAKLGVGAFTTSAPDYLSVDEKEETEGEVTLYRYFTLGVAPEISAPNVNVQPNGMIRGAMVDSTNKYIYLDTSPDGFAAESFSLVTFTTTHADTKKVEIANGDTLRSDKDLICTGDIATVTATNTISGQTAEVKYTIIIIGDTNCDGRIGAGDATRMAMHYVGLKTMDAIPLLAADTNRDGRIGAADAVKIANKYTSKWQDGTYVSSYN